MINQLKLEMNNLTRLVEAGAGLSIGEEATMNELLKQKEDLTAERDAQVRHMHCALYNLLHHVCTCCSMWWQEMFCIRAPRNRSVHHARVPAYGAFD